MKSWKENDEWSKRQNYMDKIKHYCRCGHAVYIPHRNLFVYCSWCNRRVFQNKRIEFEYKLFRSLGQVNNEEVRS